MDSSDKKRAATSLIVLIVTVLLIGGAMLASQNQPASAPTASNQPTKKQPPAKDSSGSSSMPASSSGFKDGKYSAAGAYQSPGGSQEIKITINLKDSAIIETSAEGDSKSSNSRFYQSSFISNYKQKVVGKKISEVKLDHVGNSSLTPEGFNNALEDIKKQAKS